MSVAQTKIKGGTKSDKNVRGGGLAKKSILKKSSKNAKNASGDDSLPKKPKNLPATKRERRALKMDAKKHSDVVKVIVPLWEKLRQASVEKETKFELIQQVMKKAQGILPDLCMAKDTAHLIESLLKNGTERHRYEIFAALKPQLLIIAKSRYGRFVVVKLVQYLGKDHIAEIIKLMSNKVASLLSNRYTAEIVELLYNDHATQKQRHSMLQELYGNTLALDLASKNVAKLSDAIKLNPTKKSTILKHVGQFLISSISKNLASHSMLQRLLLEYLTSELPFLATMLPGEESRDEALSYGSFTPSETLQLLLDTVVEHSQLVPMLHTREGVRAALCMLWVSNSKTKKALLKTLKTSVSGIAMDSNGHLFLMGLLDSVDDIVLIQKTVMKEFLEDLDQLICHPHGRKVILYALCPRDKRHVAPQMLQSILIHADRSPFTKKALHVRALELRSVMLGLLPALLRLVKTHLIDIFIGDRVEHSAPIKDRGRLLVMAEALTVSSAHNLSLETCMKQYRREWETEFEGVSPISAEDVALLAQLREEALSEFVRCVLAPEFVPSGRSLPTRRPEEKERVQRDRRKRALAVAEEDAVRRRKIKVDPFTNLPAKRSVKLDPSAEEMELDEDQPQKARSVGPNELSREEEVLFEMPWLERPEATNVMRMLFDECKRSGSTLLPELIMKLVPVSVLRSWTSCNRTCFFLVNLCEIGGAELVRFLQQSVCDSQLRSSLAESNMPAASILLQRLTKQ